MSHIYSSNTSTTSEEPVNSPPYNSYMNKYNNANLLQATSDNSETTTTYVDNSITSRLAENDKRTPNVTPGNGGNKSSDLNLEGQEILHNEKRLFSFLFSKKVPPVTAPEERTSYPWKTSNPLNRMMFLWLWPVLFKGYKRTLLPDDLWYLTEDLKVESMHERFDVNLNKRLERDKEKYLKKHNDLDGHKWSQYNIPLALFDTFKLQYVMSCVFLGLSFVCQALSPLITRKLIDFVQNLYETRIFGVDVNYNEGIGYTIGAVVLIFINGLLLNHFFHNAMVTGAQAKAILTKSLLLKSFNLSSKSRNQFSIGKITSLMSTDLARIDLAIGFQPLVVCFPIPVIIAVVLLLKFIGVTSLAGIGLFIVSLVICVLLTKKLFTTREEVVLYTDDRISLMREVLNNLKVIKFYAWEMAYKVGITRIRNKEMKYLFTIKVLRNFVTAYAVTLPTLTSMVSFTSMWANNNMKNPGKVFSSLSLFSILAQAIMLLPIALATGADALIGFRRCRDYLVAEEYNDDLEQRLASDMEKRYIAGDTNSEFEFKHESFDLSEAASYKNTNVNANAIEISHANFIWESFHAENSSSWDLNSAGSLSDKDSKRKKKSKSKGVNYQIHEKDSFQDSSRSSNETYCESPSTIEAIQFPGLTDINLSIKQNEFVIITGSIGSGKSSLLAALSGFMKLENPSVGQVNIYDDLLLCSDPWIQNATVRDNITFGKPYDAIRYNKVISACCLEDDIKLLPARDLTEIGERGITLSGGQKSRINLARASYADANIMLFDDVLSAVDARVGKHIVNNLFNGLLKYKTKVLATHQLSLIESADKVIYLNGDGTIDFGTLNELLARNNQFKRLVEFNTDLSRDNESGNNDHRVYENYSDSDYDNNQDFEGAKLIRQQSVVPESSDIAGKIMGDEERATNAISWDIYKKYIDLGSGFFGWSAAPVFIFLMTLATFCQLFTNTWLSYWTEKRFSNMTDNVYVALYVMFAFLTVFFTAIEFTMLAYMNNRSAKLLNVKAVEKILHAPMSYLDTTPMGRILNRFTKDTDSLDNEIGEQLRLFLFPLATIIGIVILCICYLPWFAIAVPFLSFAFVFVANFYQGSSREIKRLEAVQRSLVYNNFNETLSGMSTIKAYKVEETFIEKNDKYLNKMNEAYYVSIANQRWLGVHLDIIASIFALIICLLCITDQFHISASSTGLLLSYVIQIVGLLSLTIRSMTQVENEMNSVERLHQYAFHLPQEAAYKKPETAPPTEWPPSGYIQFNNVSLKYRDHLPTVLKNLNFSVYPGEKVGICGRTGAGKSSIMTALYRLVELNEGSIVIDGLNVADMGLYDLRSKLSIIPQDPVLFQGTIRKNLDPFNESTDEKLWDALRRSGLIDVSQLSRIKNTKLDQHRNIGYESLHKFHLDQLVADDGSNFSLGERQLIALARALVRNSKILILDEATSSVDYETDAKIQETIVNEFSHCTILCIAHRLKTILNYDRILVMDKGSLIEKGTPYNLFTNRNGIFRQMCDKTNIIDEDFQ